MGPIARSLALAGILPALAAGCAQTAPRPEAPPAAGSGQTAAAASPAPAPEVPAPAEVAPLPVPPTSAPVAASVPAEKTYLLRYRLVKGAAYGFDCTTESSLELPGEQGKLEQTVTIGVSVAVEEISASGSTRARITYDRIRFSETDPAGGEEYDSTTGGEPKSPKAIAFAALPGRGFIVTLGPDGKVERVEGTKEMVYDMADALVDRLHVPRDRLRFTLWQDFGGQAALRQLAQFLVAFPVTPIAIGGSWSHTLPQTGILPIAVQVDYRLDAVHDGLAVLGVVARVDPPAGAAGNDPTGMYSLSGKGSGSADVDLESGRIRSMTMTLDLAGTILVQTGCPCQPCPDDAVEKAKAEGRMLPAWEHLPVKVRSVIRVMGRQAETAAPLQSKP